jgi:hypothetical protein
VSEDKIRGGTGDEAELFTEGLAGVHSEVAAVGLVFGGFDGDAEPVVVGLVREFWEDGLEFQGLRVDWKGT